MQKTRVLVLIPARYDSSRFPGKPLAEIDGKSMIQRVYENVSKSSFITAVVTDDERIESHVLGFGGKVILVQDDVPSGTERIFLAYKRFFKDDGFDLVVNVQGDEPLLEADEITSLVKFHEQSLFDITTLVKPVWGGEYENPNKVKALFSENTGECLYFSRAPIPYYRDELPLSQKKWFLHIGVYSYKAKALEKFCGSELSYYENIEKLEQLRALESGMKIGAIATDLELIGVDTPDDLSKVEGVFRGRKN